MYCNRSCLWVCLWVWVCVFVRSVGEGNDHIKLIKFWPSCASGKGVCGSSKKFWLRLTTASMQCLHLSKHFFIKIVPFWSSFMWNIFKGYGLCRLHFLVNSGQRQVWIHYWVCYDKGDASNKGMAVHARVRTHWRKCGCSGADSQPGRLNTNLPFNTWDTKRDGSLLVLCNVHHILQSQSEVSEDVPRARAQWSQLPCILHARFVFTEQPWPQPVDYNIWGIIQQRV